MQLNWPEPSNFPPLPPGTIHVWAIPLEDSASRRDVCEAVLSRDERMRAEKFVLAPPRATFTVSRAALRAIVGQYVALNAADVTFVYDAFGKPQLVDSAISFNVAHSGDLTLIAVSRAGQVGVDVERLRNVEASLEIAARNFHPDELTAIRATSAPELPSVFLRCWTRKEAALKSLGVGLGYPLESFDALTSQVIDLPAHGSHATSHLWLHDLDPCNDYRAALAANYASPPPQGFTLTLDRIVCSL